MPRNGSGTYALPAGNPVSSGTLIEASWANNTLSDIASAMTDSLARSGEGGMTGPLRAADGTVSTPSVSFVSETATGFYRAGATDVRFAMAGVDVATLTTAGVTVGSTKVLALPDGTAAAPALTNTGDTNTGVFFPADNTVAVTTDGTERVRVDASGNVGIGTTSPTTKLDVSSSGTTTLRVNRLGVADVYLTAGANGIYGLDTASTNLHFGVSNSLKMTLDASGNLGLGVTPSAWTAKAIQVNARAAFWGDTTQTIVSNNMYASSGGDRYIATATAALYAQSAGQHIWFTAPSGTAGNAISFTQAMTLDASGNLGVGTTSPGVKLDVAGYIRATTNSAANIIESASDTQPVFRLSRSGGPTADFTAVGSYAELRTTNNYPLVFTTNSTERARITSGGLFGVNGTPPSDSQFYSTTAQAGMFAANFTSSNGGAYGVSIGTDSAALVYFYTSAARSVMGGSITHNGSNVAYNTSSDYRLKENIQPMTGGLAKVAQLKPCTYTWKANGTAGQGFIAHELAEVVPDAVTGEKDAVNEDGSIKAQGIDTSYLVATLTAALQEAHALIKSLEQRVAALEAQS